MNHPITYVSGLFKGSQLNWAALTKEAYAIYMSIRKLTYYLKDADINFEKWPSATKKVSTKKHTKLKGQQLGSGDISI